MAIYRAMGIFNDAVEAEHNGRHYSIRGTVTFFGGRFALYVDGRKRDATDLTYWRYKGMMSAVVDGELVCVELRFSLFGVRYRLSVGETDFGLKVEKGQSTAFVQLPPPLLLSSGRRSTPPQLMP